MTLKLNSTLREQSRILSGDLKTLTDETLIGNHNVFKSTFGSMKEQVERTTKAISNHPEIIIDIEKFRGVALEFLLASFKSEIDYAVLLNLEGHHIASFPEEVGHHIDVQWIEKHYQSLGQWEEIQVYLKNETPWNKDQEKGYSLCDLRKYDLSFIKAFDLQGRNFSDPTYLSLESVRFVHDEFRDPIALLIAGKMINGFNRPLKEYYDATGMACAIYSRTFPVAHMGFDGQEKGEVNADDLQINQDTLKKIFGADRPSQIPVTLAGKIYNTVFSAVKDHGGNKVGVICVGIPQEQIIESEQTFLAHGIKSIKNLKVWFFGIGGVTLLFFMIISLFISNTIVKPVEKLLYAIQGVAKGDFNQQIEINSRDEIGRLAQTFNAMVKRLREQREQLENAKEVAEAASNSKSEFLANVSHELRTPLNHIIGFTDLVVKKNFGEINDIQDEYLNNVLRSSHHLLSLINDILDLSMAESGKAELNLSEVYLKLLMENSLVMIEDEAMKHEIRLSKDLDHVPEIIRADERGLRQILYNLLSNAVKFTPKGGSIHLAARPLSMVDGRLLTQDGRGVAKAMPLDELPAANGNLVEISVKDTGIGIRQENLKSIFDPFYQVESSASRIYQGTGLGLSLVRNLVELHGGRITVESEGEGKGSCFRFIIPV